MAEKTGIKWCHSSFNPWLGCTEVSDACANCYARDMATNRMGLDVWGSGVPRKRTGEMNWKQPLKWNKDAGKLGARWLVFGGSMCDFADNEVDPQWQRDYAALIAGAPHLTWLLLTKRIGNVLKLYPEWAHGLPANVWLGASIGNQMEADRDIHKLLATPAAKRFISYEPTLGPINFTEIKWKEDGADLCMNVLNGDCIVENSDSPSALSTKDDGNPAIDWIIVGGESGSGRRPMDMAWPRSVIDQCKAAGVPVFVKQDNGAQSGMQGRFTDAEWALKEFPA